MTEGLFAFAQPAAPTPKAYYEELRDELLADLQAALRVIGLLTHCIWREQVRAVSVSNHGGRRDPSAAHIRLLLGGSEVRWGRAPGEEMGVEIPAADKIAVLQGLYNQHGRIDAGRRHVDVRFSRTDVGVPSADTTP